MDTFIVEGRWAVEALLGSPFTVLSVSVENGRHSDLVSILEREDISMRICERRQLEADRGYAFHRGVFAEVIRPRPQSPPTGFLKGAKRLAAGLRPLTDGRLCVDIRRGYELYASLLV